ncbi:MAG TPA: hypothetical protein VES42_23470 [Pilimelia sp.]|nr:hypothetical protein [Pilimelia sp.]
MPDLHSRFIELRRWLEPQAQPPEFGLIRARRRRRTQRLATSGVAVAVVVTVFGAAIATGAERRPARVTASEPPAPTAQPTPDGDSAPGLGSRVDGLAATGAGGLYALISTCEDGAQGCDPTGSHHTVFRSADSGATWRAVGPAPRGNGLLAADAQHLWVDGVRVGGSADGGRTWRTWRLDPGRDWSESEHDSDVAGGTAWFTLGPHVYVARDGGRPVRAPAQPPGFSDIYEIAAVDADRAVVMGARNNGSPGRWYETRDRGRHWTPVADPCAGLPGEGSLYSVLSVAPDGARWAVCVPPPPDEPDAGVPPSTDAGPALRSWPRQQVLSTDGGRTWQRRGALDAPSSGIGTFLHATSATVNWLTVPSGGVYRTVDGTATRVADVTPPDGFVWKFVAADSMIAGYVDAAAPDFRLTRDGGATWTSHRLPIRR